MTPQDSGVRQSRRLLLVGTALFLLGLINGALVPVLPNRPQAISAHLTGLQDGVVLWAVGLMWQRLRLGPRPRTIVSVASIYSMYAIWLGLFVAAFATHGASAAGDRELLRAAVGALEVTGSIAILGASVGLVAGLRAGATGQLIAAGSAGAGGEQDD